MKNLHILGTLLACCLLLETVPRNAEAQTCAGSCEVCTGMGHSYGVFGEAAMGNQYHGCGNQAICGGGQNVHNACDGDADAGKAIQRLQDAVDLLHYEDLSGSRIRDVVAQSNGRFYVNPSRRAIQQLHCRNVGEVIANLPLSPAQFEEYLAAAADDWEVLASAIEVPLSPMPGQQ